MAIKGERFEIDLDSSNLQAFQHDTSPYIPFVKDILEKDNDNFTLPIAPKFKATQNGFPQPRVPKGLSKFKREALKQSSSPTTEPIKKKSTFDEAERTRIDQENQQRIQDMSPEEIEQAQQELFAALSSSRIEKLLKRSHIDIPQDDFDKPLREANQQNQTSKDQQKSQNTHIKQSTQQKPDPPKEKKKTVSFAETIPLPETTPSSNPQPASLRTIHFPSAPIPILDPSSTTFLTDLHKKYFPSLPYDPQALSWMTSPHPSTPSSYSSSATSFSPSELRFDFQGNLLPPNLANQIPTTKGLHHHGLAPEAAGYTIAELGIYARSTVQAQRCMAFQTLGRFLYKLGTGVFGDDSPATTTATTEEKGGEAVDGTEEYEDAVLCRGLWEEVARERVLDVLLDEANQDQKSVKHKSAHALAVEAVWLWRRGGGRRVSAERIQQQQ